ncbi:hypothetical protein CR513_49741, partial [Mucuna pruriens]
MEYGHVRRRPLEAPVRRGELHDFSLVKRERERETKKGIEESHSEYCLESLIFDAKQQYPNLVNKSTLKTKLNKNKTYTVLGTAEPQGTNYSPSPKKWIEKQHKD